MKIGILTFHRAYNYGAYLQACALCNRLNQEMGIDAEIIDYRMEREKKRYHAKGFSLKKKLYQISRGTFFFQRAIEKSFIHAIENPVMQRSQGSLTSDSIDDFTQFVNRHYDVIIVGSDEVWKVNNFRGFPTPYWLFGNLHCRKFSYAASARVEFEKELSAENYCAMKQALDDFEYIGVRDQFTYNEVQKAIGKSDRLHLCCDPSFLYDFSVPDTNVLRKIAKKRGYHPQLKTIMVMLDNDEYAEYVKSQLGGEYNLVSVFHYHKGFMNIAELEPLEWLGLIIQSDFVIASFFHAICFSLINNKPFLGIGTKGKKSKLEELLSTSELQKHYIQAEQRQDLKRLVAEFLKETPDYSDFVSEQRKTFDDFLTKLKTES